MSSTIWRGRELLGSQRPRVWSAASATTSAGGEAVALAELAGLECMPWQRLVVDGALGQCVFGPGPDDWRWAAFEVLLLVSRQNGKGTCIEVVELYVLFSLGLNVFHTAHLMKTSRKAFKRLWALIERTPQLRRRVAWVRRTAEEITVTLTSGAFVTFMARSGRAGRGLDDCDVLVLDESLFLDPKMAEAMVPTMSTRPHPLVIYAGSAEVATSTLQRALRKRLHDGDPGLTGFDWSVDPELVKAKDFDPLAVEAVAQANPSLGALISMDYVRGEFRALTAAGSPQGYYRERLGVPDTDPAEAKPMIGRTAWEARGGLGPERPTGPVAFGIAAAPDGLPAWTAIGVVGETDAGERLLQVVEYRPGSEWVPERVKELVGRHVPVATVVDPAGPAGFLIDDLEDVGVEVFTPTPRQVAHATKQLVTGLVGEAPFVRHYDQPHLGVAAVGAAKKLVGDVYVPQRRGEVDICPFEAVLMASLGLDAVEAPEPLFAWSS